MFASLMWCFIAWKSLKHNTNGTWWIGFDDFIKYPLFTGWFIFSTCLWQDHDKIYCSNMLRCWEKPLPVLCSALFSQSVLKTNVDVVTLCTWHSSTIFGPVGVFGTSRWRYASFAPHDRYLLHPPQSSKICLTLKQDEVFYLCSNKYLYDTLPFGEAFHSYVGYRFCICVSLKSRSLWLNIVVLFHWTIL